MGFKNGTDGSVSVAVDAMRSASNPHAFMGVTEQGLAAIVRTRGNQDVHVILRGGTKGPNFKKEFVQDAATALRKVRPDSHPSIMVDASRKPLHLDISIILGLINPTSQQTATRSRTTTTSPKFATTSASSLLQATPPSLVS